MTTKRKNLPLLGEAFNPEQMNMGDVFEHMADELFYYMPDKRSARVRGDLSAAKEAYRTDCSVDSLSADNRADMIQLGHDAITDAEDMLTEFAQTVEKHDFIYFTVSGPFAGFRIDVDAAIEDADWKYSCDGSREHGAPHKPGDGAGLEVFVNDHGNVTAWLYGANGHKRELFSVV